MQNQLLCSIAEAGATLGLGRTKIYEMLESGEIRSVRIGGRRLVIIESLNAFVEKAKGEQA